MLAKKDKTKEELLDRQQTTEKEAVCGRENDGAGQTSAVLRSEAGAPPFGSGWAHVRAALIAIRACCSISHDGFF